MTTATAEVNGPVVVEESTASRVVRWLGKTPVYLVVVFVGALWLIPTFGLLLTSLIVPEENQTAAWWDALTTPSLLTIDNYTEILQNEAITSAIWTTLWISLGATAIPIVVAALAGYALAWLEFPARDWLFIVVVALLVVPIQMALIPIFSLYNNLGLYGTIPGLILFHTAFGLPFAIFLLRNFFIGIPKDLIEAARIDGASEIRIFSRLILPLGLPAIASLAIFQFLWVWNDLLVALVFGAETQPITVAIFSQLRAFGANIELIAPAAFLSMAIPLAVFFAFQRYFVQGLLAGSVK
jgi:alpha-glucoside transport system permease protein